MTCCCRIVVFMLFSNLGLLDLIFPLELLKYYSRVSCKAPQTLYGRRKSPNNYLWYDGWGDSNQNEDYLYKS